MDIKKLAKSKTFYTALGSIGFGISLITQGNTETGIQAIIMGLGMIFGRDAIAKVEK